MKKKYRLRCFSCKAVFKDKDEVIRHEGRPYCFFCIDEARTEMPDFTEEQWKQMNKMD